jgi:hypothetical protein
MNKFILVRVAGCFFLVGATVCYADKWDKNDLKDRSVETTYYDADSIKVQGTRISCTVKFILTKDGAKSATQNLLKFPTCKQSIDKKGDVAQYQQDLEIEEGKASIIESRYYNKANEMLCTDKDLGKRVKSWTKIPRHSRMGKIYYDLVTKYKIVVPK